MYAIIRIFHEINSTLYTKKNNGCGIQDQRNTMPIVRMMRSPRWCSRGRCSKQPVAAQSMRVTHFHSHKPTAQPSSSGIGGIIQHKFVFDDALRLSLDTNIYRESLHLRDGNTVTMIVWTGTTHTHIWFFREANCTLTHNWSSAAHRLLSWCCYCRHMKTSTTATKTSISALWCRCCVCCCWAEHRCVSRARCMLCVMDVVVVVSSSGADWKNKQLCGTQTRMTLRQYTRLKPWQHDTERHDALNNRGISMA